MRKCHVAARSMSIDQWFRKLGYKCDVAEKANPDLRDDAQGETYCAVGDMEVDGGYFDAEGRKVVAEVEYWGSKL
jgi:hypothetical protein